MTKASRRFHSIMISITLSVVAWRIIDYFIIPIDFLEFFLIEILLAIGEVFSTFVKEKTGLKEPDSCPKSCQH